MIFPLTCQYAGREYQIDLEGWRTDRGSLDDPVLLGIHDVDGTLITGTTDDDGGAGLNSRVRFEAPETGTYYIAAGAYEDYTQFNQKVNLEENLHRRGRVRGLHRQLHPGGDGCVITHTGSIKKTCPLAVALFVILAKVQVYILNVNNQAIIKTMSPTTTPLAGTYKSTPPQSAKIPLRTAAYRAQARRP